MQVEDEFADDAVLPLTVGGTVEEDGAIKVRLLVFARVRPCLPLELLDRVDQVFDRQMCVADYELAVVLVECDGDVEEFFAAGMLRVKYLHVFVVATRGLGTTPGLAQLQNFLNAVVFSDHVSMHCVHGHIVIVDTLLVECVLVQLQIVALQYLVLVEWERILNGYILNVFVGE